MKIKGLRDEDLLYEDVELHIDKIKRKKNIYLVFYRIIKMLTFIGGAGITILVGWDKNPPNALLFKHTILIISACITFIAAFEGIFNLKDKALAYDVFLFELRRLRDGMSFDFNKDPGIYNQKREEYFNKFQEILSAQKSIIEDSFESED